MATIGTLVVALVSDTARFEQGFVRARRQSDELERAMRQLEKGGLDRLTAGMTASAAQTGKVSDWMRRLGDASSQTAGTIAQTARGGEALSAGFRKAENAIIDVGLKMVGLDGKAAKLAEGLLLMGVGGSVTLAVAGGLALLGTAYHALTRETREAAEQQRAFADRTREAAAQRLRSERPAEGFKEDFRRLSQEAEQLNRDLAEARRPRTFVDRQDRVHTLVDQQAIAAAEQRLADFRTRATEVARQYLEAMGRLSEGTRTTADQITYDWGRVRNVFAEEITDRLGKERVQAFERRQRAIQDMITSRQAPSRFDQSPDELAREVERAANRAGDRAGQATLERIAKTAQGRQKALADFTEEVWKSAARNIQSATASTFESIFNGQLKSLAAFASSVVGIVQRAVAEILAAQTVSGLGPILRNAFGGGGGIPAAPDTSFIGGANAGIPRSFNRAPVVVHQHITYAPTVHAIDAQGVQQFYRRTRGTMIAELARAAQDSRLVPASVSR